MASVYTTIDSLVTTTLVHYASKVMADNVFDRFGLTWWLKSKGRSKTAPGGLRIVEPVLLAENDTVGMIGMYDTIATNAQEGQRLAEYQWKYLAGSVVIAKAEMNINSGPAAVLNLAKARTTQCEQTMTKTLAAQIHGSNVGTDNNMLGLQVLIDSGTTTIGEISPSTYTTWVSYEAAAATLTHSAMRTLKNTLFSQGSRLDLYVTGLTGFDALEGLVQPQQRFTDAKMADAGFHNLMFGGIPCMLDGGTASGVLYAIDSSAMNLTAHSDFGNSFKTEGPYEPHNQLTKNWLLWWQGNLTCNCRRHLGKLTGITG